MTGTGGSKPYTQRVQIGSYYTDGASLAEVVDVHSLGGVDLQDTTTGRMWSVGIDAFRRKWWLVRKPGTEAGS